MNYKRQETKYNHYNFEDKWLIGVSKQISEEEAAEAAKLFFYSPMLMYERNVYGKILQLKQKDRQSIINALDKWEKGKSKETSFVGLYWDIVLDFILAQYEKTTFDLAKEMLEISYAKDEKTLFDNIENMRNNKGSVREEGRKFIRRICYYYKITEDVVRTGKGVIYHVENGKAYTAEKVDAYCNSHDNIILKEMVADITGVKENEIQEFQIQIAVSRKRLENKIYDFLDILLDEMIKNRE